MYLRIAALLFCLFPLLSPAQNDTLVRYPDTTFRVPCNRYHIGRFEYIDANFQGITFKRKKKKQIEYNKLTDAKSVFKIKWDGDCAYTQTFVRSNKPSRFRKGWSMQVKIVVAYIEYYDFDADLHGIMYYGSARRVLTRGEMKKQERERVRKEYQRIKDSVAAVEAAMDTVGKDAEETVQPDPEAEGKGKDKKKKGKQKKEKGKKGKEKKDKEKGKTKKEKDKPAKEKKEKDKAGKEKTKKEKPPKEKKKSKDKEKPDKEDKEKKKKEKDKKAEKEK